MKLVDFNNPISKYRPMPFWFWNFTEKDDYRAIIKDDIFQMHQKGLGGFVIFNKPPFGFDLETYLGEDWFKACRIALDAATKYKIKVWINDGFDYPPGDLAGRMKQLCPEAVHQELVCEKKDVIDNKFNYSLPQGPELISAVAVPESNELKDSVDVKDSIINGTSIELDKGNWQVYLVLSQYITRPDGFLNHFPTFLDPQVSSIFIREVYKKYKKHLGQYFGKTLVGFFSDCDARASHPYPWARNFAERFAKEKGYDITSLLAALWFDLDENTSKVRTDYHEFISSLYSSWFKNNYSWCQDNGLKYTYHTSDTGPFSPFDGFKAHCKRSSIYSEGRFHEVNKYADFPGTDHELLALAGQLHFGFSFDGKPEEFVPKTAVFGKECTKNSYNRMESENKTFGDIRAKYASSVAHINDREGAMCELFAATNWDVTFEDFRKIADWQAVQGITFFVPHAFYSSLEGMRKQFAPPNHFKQSHLWKYYKVFSDYIGRLSFMLSQGDHIADIAVLDTSVSVWNKENKNNDSLFYIADILNHSPWDYDIIAEQDLLEAQIENGTIGINKEKYKVLILPFYSSYNPELDKRLKDFIENNGLVICCDEVSKQLPYDKVKCISDFRYPNETIAVDNELIDKLKSSLSPDCIIKDNKGNEIKGVHFNHRKTDGSDIYFITNLEGLWPTGKTIITLKANQGVPVLWDHTNSQRKGVEYRKVDKRTEIVLDTIESQSFFIVFENSERNIQIQTPTYKSSPIDIDWKISLEDQNICPVVLWKNQKAETVVWGKGALFDSLKTTFDSDGLHKLNMVIPVKIADSLIKFNDIRINDLGSIQEIIFDEKYISFDVSEYLRNGTNSILIEQLNNDIFTSLEYSPIYLKGNFRLNIDIDENSTKLDFHKWYHFKSFIYEGTDFSLEKQQEIPIGDISKQGYPFYSGQIIYEAEIDLSANNVDDYITLDLGSVHGSVEIYLNDRFITNLIWPPYKVNICDLKPGKNKITIKYAGTLANILEGYPARFGLDKICLFF